jgi:hypothetical protein
MSTAPIRSCCRCEGHDSTERGRSGRVQTRKAFIAAAGTCLAHLCPLLIFDP